LWARKDLGVGYANHLGIAAESSQREDVAPDPTRVDLVADCVDAFGDLVARHDRNWRQVGV
jgi:hypothetical protein